MRWISPAKLKIGGVILAGSLVSGLGGTVLFNGIAHGEWDWPGINQQVQHLTEVTDNHEGRITNLENQTSTPSGSPTPSPVVVTKVVTMAAPQATASPSATPAPVLGAQSTPQPTPKVCYYKEGPSSPGNYGLAPMIPVYVNADGSCPPRTPDSTTSTVVTQ